MTNVATIAKEVGNILLFGLLFGAGLPAIFAIGMRALNPVKDRLPSAVVSDRDGVPTGAIRSSGQPEGFRNFIQRVHPLGLIVAIVCFAICIVAVLAGIDLMFAAGRK